MTCKKCGGLISEVNVCPDCLNQKHDQAVKEFPATTQLTDQDFANGEMTPAEYDASITTLTEL